METLYRVPFIENWAIIGMMIQIFLLGLVNYRMYGQWASNFLKTGNNSVLMNKPYDRTSIWLLLCNAYAGGVILVTSQLIGTYFLSTSLVLSCIGLLVFFLIWHMDYFSFWIFSKNNLIEQLLSGNVLLYVFGISLFLFNVVHFFKIVSFNVTVGVIGLFLCLFITRTLNLARRLNALGFSWYYFILYFCTVYVVPSVLLSKHYSPHWLELLTP